MPRVVIIGGGITGLAAAYTLEEARRGGQHVDYLLLEKEKRWGGKILTLRENGFTIEGGPDCFVSDKPWVLELSSRLGIKERLLPSNEENKGTHVFSRGRLHKLPEGLMLMVPTRIMPFVFSSLISWPGKLRMALDLVIPPEKGEKDESLGSFVTRRLGREALEKIAEPLIGGIHAGNPDRMSLNASFPRFLQMEKQYGSLIKAMLAARRKTSPPRPDTEGSPWTYFMSFQGGMADLTDTLAASLDQNSLFPGRGVRRLSKMADRPSYMVTLESGEKIEADAIILAVLANHAAPLLEGLNQDLADLVSQISLASSATVNMVFPKSSLPFYPSSFGFVVPAREKRRVMAVTYSSIKWKYRIPDQELILLRAFVGGNSNQDLAEAGEQELEKVVQAELKDIIGINAIPSYTKIFRWRNGMPQYTLGHLDRVQRQEELAACQPGLYLAGASYRGIGTPDCINSGTKAAQSALSFLYNN